MTGEVKVERDCVKMTHRTFVLFIIGVITMAAITVMGYSKIVYTQERILSTMRVVVGTCCPEETKRFFDGYQLGMAENNHR